MFKMGVFDKLKDFIMEENAGDGQEGYAELEEFKDISDRRIAIKIFDIKQESDIKNVLNELREGKTIALISRNITLSDAQLKMMISKLKKTCDAANGDVVGLSESLFIATPSMIKVDRESKA